MRSLVKGAWPANGEPGWALDAVGGNTVLEEGKEGEVKGNGRGGVGGERRRRNS